MALPLPDLFPDEDYRFHLTLRKGNLAEFFAGHGAAILTERQGWLAADPARYVAATADASDALAEMEALAPGWHLTGPVGFSGDLPLIERLTRLGGRLEPDFLLLTQDDAKEFRLRAGAVCFPSAWSLPEKIGKLLDDIHHPVPGLNSSLSSAIGKFLSRLKPDLPYERANWGLAATPEMNLHPGLNRPRLALPLDSGQIWLRVEDQILAALPQTGAILFGIRLRIFPLREILGDARLRAGFHRALATMPEDLAVYKGIAAVRPGLLASASGL